jgi:checkpoint serine/threonine-protein kinase
MAAAVALEEMVRAARRRDAGVDGSATNAKSALVAVGAKWETFKENVRPLKHRRDVSKLNRALKAQIDPAQRAALLEARRYGYI